MITSHTISPHITRRTAAMVAVGMAIIGLVATSVNLARPASALDCVRAPHSVTVTPETASQTGTPGTTLTYHLEITNNDSAGCGLSEFTFDGTNIPADWTVSPYQGTELVDATETTVYSIAYTSGANTYNGVYDYDVEVFRAEEPTVVTVPVSYTVIGGQDIPTPDTIAPSLSITSPAANASVKKGSTVVISVSASDNVGVTKVEFYVNNTLVCTGTATTCNWAVPNTRATFQLTVKAYDAAGNVTTKVVAVQSR